MSFLKIADPVRRDQTVKEFLAIKKNIRANKLAEKTGKMELQTDLSEFFKPITETQKATTEEITKGLKPIKEGIERMPQAIRLPAFPSITAYRVPESVTDIEELKEKEKYSSFIGKTAEHY